MIKRIGILLLLIAAQQLFAQEERGYVRKGNQKYIEGKYEEAEKEYHKALDINNNLTEGVFNLGDAAYQKKDYEQAEKQFETAAMLAKDNRLKAKAYHNLGNTYLDAAQYDKSVEAYKNALRLNPDDMDTKYNLAYAQQMLKKNPQQNRQDQNQENQDQNQDKKDRQEKNQEQQNQDRQQQAEQNQQQQQQSQEQQAKEEQAEQQQAQPKEGQISKEDARRLLEALMQQEQKVQQQIVNKKLPPAEKKNVEKDW